MDRTMMLPRSGVAGVVAFAAVVAMTAAFTALADAGRGRRVGSRLRAASSARVSVSTVLPSTRSAAVSAAGSWPSAWLARQARCRPLLCPPARFVGRVEPMALPLDPASAWLVLLAALVVVPTVAGFGGGMPLAVLALAALVGCSLAGAHLGRDRTAGLVDDELPLVLDQIASSLRSGASLPHAISESADRALGPVSEDLTRLRGGLAAGQSLADGLSEWRCHRPTAGVRLAVAALRLAAELGGQARPIDGVAATLRERLAVDRELRAVSAQARASAVVIVAAPFAFTLLLGAGDTAAWRFFVESPAGLACLAGGLLLDGIGAWWMLHLLRRPA
jgi:tight adherence protein B